MHVNPFIPLGGALRGTLPNPTLADDASTVIGRQVFGPRRLRPFDPLAGTNITITPDAMGVSIAAPATEDASPMLARSAFGATRPPRIPKVQAGTNATVTENALGPVVSATAAYTSTSVDLTLDETHSTVAVDTSGGNRTITLPTAVGIVGRIYRIKRTTAGVNTLTVDANGTQTIDGNLTVLLPNQWDVLRIQSDGANWLII